jgi:hypothetical protein
MRYALVLLTVLAAVAFMECSTDEDMVTMPTILAAGGLLGFLFRRHFLLSGVLVGLVVPTVALFSQKTGWHPAYETASVAASHGPRYAASLLILVIPAIIAAAIGRWLISETDSRAKTVWLTPGLGRLAERQHLGAIND